MSRSKMSFSARRRLNTSIKVAALVSALAFVTVILEQPRLTAAPNHPRATAEQGRYRSGERTPADVATAAIAEPSFPKPSESLPVFPSGHFAAPGGPVDAQPPTF